MIITRMEFLSRTKLDQHTLDIWIEEEWLSPEALNPSLRLLRPTSPAHS
jgi:hypothetical protein